MSSRGSPLAPTPPVLVSIGPPQRGSAPLYAALPYLNRSLAIARLAGSEQSAMCAKVRFRRALRHSSQATVPGSPQRSHIPARQLQMHSRSRSRGEPATRVRPSSKTRHMVVTAWATAFEHCLAAVHISSRLASPTALITVQKLTQNGAHTAVAQPGAGRRSSRAVNRRVAVLSGFWVPRARSLAALHVRP